MNLNTVRVYSTPSCVQCMLTKKWFNDRDISFDEVDLTESEDDYRAVLALGYKAAPIVMVAPDVHWGGFRADLLELHFGEKRAA